MLFGRGGRRQDQPATLLRRRSRRRPTREALQKPSHQARSCALSSAHLPAMLVRRRGAPSTAPIETGMQANFKAGAARTEPARTEGVTLPARGGRDRDARTATLGWLRAESVLAAARLR